MARIEHSVTIDKPLFDVYQRVADFEARKSWQPDLLNVGITAGNPLRAGSMIAMERRFMGRRVFVNVDVIDIQRNKLLDLKGVHGIFPYTRTIEFSSSGRSTTIRDTINIRTSLLYFWYTPFLTNALRSQTKSEWANLKKQMEQGR